MVQSHWLCPVQGPEPEQWGTIGVGPVSVKVLQCGVHKTTHPIRLCLISGPCLSPGPCSGSGDSHCD